MKLSIIIPTYNSSSVLSRAIDSILEQSFTDYEILIMDGASKDDTVGIALAYKRPEIRIFSERDNGIYDAMNKGIAKSRGEWLYFLGSDDWLMDGSVLQKVFDTENMYEYDVVYGDVEAEHLPPQCHGKWTFEDIYFNRCHQAIFYRRNFLERQGGYNLKYPIAADYDLNLKWLLGRRFRSLFIDETVAHFSDAGVSTLGGGDRIFLKDRPRLLLTRGFLKLSRRQRKMLLFDVLNGNAAGRSLIWIAKAIYLAQNWFQHVRLLWHKRIHGIRRPIVHLYSICWNEEKILPYMFSHYDGFVDKFYIYDNRSTDSSPELIKGNKKAEMFVYAPEKIDDQALRDLKNRCWKKSRGKADYVIVCDMDEFLYHTDVQKMISTLSEGGYTVCCPQGYEMCSDVFPEYENGTKLTDLVKYGVKKAAYSKCVMFNPYKIININYYPGAHRCNPSGIVKMYEDPELKLLHYKLLGVDNVIERYAVLNSRLSEDNIRKGYALHYRDDSSRIRANFKKISEESVRVIS